MPLQWFYENYEGVEIEPVEYDGVMTYQPTGKMVDQTTRENHAKQIDSICLSCPVQTFCRDYGIENKQDGIWGGIYLNSGEIDKRKNEHKTEAIWKELL